MKKEIVINMLSFFKSKLSLDCYCVLQIISENDVDLFEKIIKTNDHSLNIIKYLSNMGFLKYTGVDLKDDLKDVSTLDILDFLLTKKANVLFKNDELSKKIHEVDSWIQDYRLKFKGIKSNSMGDPKACLKKMKMFLTDNPEYSKVDIFKAVDNYINETQFIYVMQADYFIYKSGLDRVPTSKLLMYCENITLGKDEDTYTEIL